MSSRPSRGAARLAAILDALPDALVLVNANGTVVNANSMALETLEAQGTALVGRGLLDLLPYFDSRLIPGSMRRSDTTDELGRTKPTRMMARRTDGSEFPVEVTSANLERSQQAYDTYAYGGDELLMLVVRDLSGTIDTEAELARSQRQTEMILRAAAEGVVGTDTDGRVVLVNPAAAQILGYRASDLGGKELHTLVLHSRADGAPFPYAESPLADTLRSGRKHRVRGQVLWSKKGEKVSVDLTTAPVRDGDQLVGAVMTFTDRRPYDALAAGKEEEAARHREELARVREEHAAELARLREQHAAELDDTREQHAAEFAEVVEAHEEELAAEKDRYAALAEREKDRYEVLDQRHEQLLAVLGGSLRGPLDELRRELSALAADDAGQLWPEANQVLHHLSAGYARITTLVDNVLNYQRLDAGADQLYKRPSLIDAVVAAAVDGAVELIGPGRAQFAVHAPPVEAEVDPDRLATALAHLVADVAGVDSTGNAPVTSGGYMDSTIVVAAAQRGDVVRIEVRGPYSGGDLVHEPIVRGIVRAHGGVLQTHEVPGMSGSAYVLEVPIGGAAVGFGAVAPNAAGSTEQASAGGAPHAGDSSGAASYPGGSSFPGDSSYPGDSPADGGASDTGAEISAADSGAYPGTGTGAELALPEQAQAPRRRARRSSVDSFLDSGLGGDSGESVSQDADGPGFVAADGDTGDESAPPTGRRRGRRAKEPAGDDAQASAAPAPLPGAGTGRRRGRPSSAEGAVTTAAEHAAGSAAAGAAVPPQGVPAPTGRRARRNPQQPALPAAPALPPGSSPGPATPADATTPTGPHPVQAPPTGAIALGTGTPANAAAGAPARGWTRGPESSDAADASDTAAHGDAQQPAARRARRALGPAPRDARTSAPGAPRAMFALPPAEADRTVRSGDGTGGHAAALHDPSEDHTPLAPHPVEPTGRRRAAPSPRQVQGPERPTPQDPGHQADLRVNPRGVAGAPQQGAGHGAPGRSGSTARPGGQSWPGQPVPPGTAPAPGPSRANPTAPGMPASGTQAPAAPARAGRPELPSGTGPSGDAPGPRNTATSPEGDQGGRRALGPATPPAAGQGPRTGAGPAGGRPARRALPAQAGPPPDPDSTQGRAFSVRTLGQGVPFGRQVADQPSTGGRPVAAPDTGPSVSPLTRVPSHQPPRQAAPPGGPAQRGAQSQTPPPAGPASGPATGQTPLAQGRRRRLGTRQDGDGGQNGPGAQQSVPAQSRQPAPARPGSGAPVPPPPPAAHTRLASASEGAGRSYAIGAPDENADEGPEPLDGPGGAVEVSDQPLPQPPDDELPPEPLDNPRRLLVWPAPDVHTQQALSDRGYRPVIVHSREEVDAQIAAFPAALFVDPLTGPITRTALQSLRQAAVAAEVPVLVTAGLGQATREAAYGADPAVLLKALAPRDSEQHPPRVLLIEEHPEIAMALTATLERRGMQVACAATDTDAVTLATQMHPNLVVMDLMQVRRRRAGIVDWLSANGQLNHTPLVVYTAAVDRAELPRLAAGETVLFLAERSTSGDVQSRIVDLLARIGTN